MDTVAIDVGSACVSLAKWDGRVLQLEKLPTGTAMEGLAEWIELLKPMRGFRFHLRMSGRDGVAEGDHERVMSAAEALGASKRRSVCRSAESEPLHAALRWSAARHRMGSGIALEVGAEQINAAWFREQAPAFSSHAVRRRGAAGVHVNLVDGMREALLRVRRAPAEQDVSEIFVCGGDGPPVAAEFALRVGVRRIWIPDYAGCFGAVGMALNGDSYEAAREVGSEVRGDETLRSVFNELMEQIAHDISLEGYDFDDVICETWISVRREGMEETTLIPWRTSMGLDELEHAVGNLTGPTRGQRSPVCVQQAVARARVDVSRTELPPPPLVENVATRPLEDAVVRRVMPDGRIMDRESIRAGERIEGPAAIREPWHVTVVPAGWQAEVARAGGISLSLSEPGA